MNVRFGALARYKGQEDVSVSGYYDIFSVKESVSKEYMENFLLSEPMINYYNTVSTGSLKEKQRVHFSQFLDFVLPIPPLPEQQKIAEILSTQDKLIELQERKINQLKTLKKAYLQKMFPKKGSKYPELRFKGFTDPWEQRKLNEVGIVIDPHPSHRAPAEENGGIPFIGIGDVDEMGNINRETARPVSENVYDEHHRRYDLCIPSLGLGRVASLGKVIRLRSDIGKYAISPTMSVLQFNKMIDIDYMYAFMNSSGFKKQFEGKSNGSTRQSVGTEMVRLLDLDIPSSLEEQKAIGAFYKDLDNLITLHQRKLDEEKQKKKALMQLLLTGKVRCI
ncbi:MAG: restriction endonuclease subunit S [Ruminococcus sp.]|nr:restriction endonuclease subunit S [Ruminococcus sp.]